MIRAQGLTKKFDGIAAIDALTFDVEEGEIFGLVGPDGAGKTTTMRLLTSIMDPDAGEAWWPGTTSSARPRRESRIGYEPAIRLYADLTVMENIDFYADIYNVPRKGRAERVERLLAFSTSTVQTPPGGQFLPGGMKQKLDWPAH